MAERREELRAADVDRAFVADRLKAALDEGRLSLGEYDERLQETYAARTYGDLDKLLSDLPLHLRSQQVVAAPPAGAATVASSPVAPAGDAAPHRSVPRWLATVWGAWLTAVLMNVAIWGAIVLSTGRLIYFWPIWVAGPWGALLFATTITGLLTGEPPRYVDKRQRRAERRARRAR